MSTQNIGNLAIQVLADISQLQKALRNAKKEVKDFATISNKEVFVADPAIKEMSKVSRSAKEIGQSVGRSLTNIFSGMTKRYNPEINKIVDLYKSQGRSISEYGSGGLKQLWNDVGMLKGAGLKGFLANLHDGLRSASGNFFQFLKSGSSDLLNWMRTKSGTFFEAFRPRSILATIGGGIGSITSGLGSLGGRAIDSIPTVLSKSFGMMKQMGSFLLGLPGQVANIFGTLNPFSGIIGSFTQFKTIAVLGLGALTFEAIKLSAEFEKIEVGFSALTKSTTTASKLVKELRLEAADMPFTSRDLLGAGRRLLAYGIEVDNIIPTIRMLGDVTSAVGNDYANLEHFAYLFGTLRQQTHAFTRDLNQFTNLGVPMKEYLAIVMKVREEEIQSLHEQGKVGFYEYAQAFKLMTQQGGAFYQYSDKISKTLAGRWEAFKDNAQIALSKIGDILVNEFGVKDWMNNLIKNLQQIDTWIAKNRSDVVYIFDIIKAGGNALYAGAIHLAAGFKVGWEIAQQLFPNTFAYFDRLIKQGKDWQTSWQEAKSNMTNVFESIASAFAAMVDSMVNGIQFVVNQGIKAARVMPGSGWSSSEKQRYAESKSVDLRQWQLVNSMIEDDLFMRTDERMNELRQMFRQYGKEDLFNLMIKNDPNLTGPAARSILKESRSYLNNPAYNDLQKYGTEYDKLKGFELYTRDVDKYGKEVAEFFKKQREIQLEITKQQQAQMEQEAKRLLDARKEGLNLLNPYAKGMFNPNTAKNVAISNIEMLPGLANLRGFENALTQSIYDVMQKKIDALQNLNKGYWDNLIKTAQEGKRQAEFKPPAMSPEMSTFWDSLKQDLSPLQEFQRDMEILKKLKGVPGLDPLKIAQGYDKVMTKAEKAFGLGADNIRFSDAIYKGTSEAISIENKWAVQQFGGTPQERFNSLMEESVEIERQQREYMRKILEALVVETGPMPREVPQ